MKKLSNKQIKKIKMLLEKCNPFYTFDDTCSDEELRGMVILEGFRYGFYVLAAIDLRKYLKAASSKDAEFQRRLEKFSQLVEAYELMNPKQVL